MLPSSLGLGGAFIEKALVLSGHKFERSTLLDEVLICIKEHIAHLYIVHGTLPEPVGGIPWTLGMRVPRRRPPVQSLGHRACHNLPNL